MSSIRTDDPRYLKYTEDEINRAESRYGDVLTLRPMSIVVQDPFTMVIVTGTSRFTGAQLHGVGFAKRNPTDAPSIRRGLSIATFRAVRHALGID